MSPTPFVVLALCGLAIGAELDGRIVGGKPTTIEQYPYQLSLRRYDNHICGASIIGPNHALTAAHCVNGTSAIKITMHAGMTYKYQTGSRHQAKKITVHPQYNGMDYDFAIVEVSTPFPIGKAGVQSVELCPVEPLAGQTAVISGWGRLSAGGSSPDQLHFVNIPIISRTVCQSKYSQYTITPRMFCAAVENGGKDACQGDSGGPLIVNGKQCGVVSWGIGCASAEYPGVYANIANQRSWIKSISNV